MAIEPKFDFHTGQGRPPAAARGRGGAPPPRRGRAAPGRDRPIRGRDGALLAELQALRVGEEYALERADVARKIRERLVERGPADLRVELGALRAWRRALVGEPDVEESPAAPTDAPAPSDDISEAAGKRLMLAIYMGTIAGVLQILALCTRGHWSKTDYDLADFMSFGAPTVMTVSLDLWRGYIEFDADCAPTNKPCRDASDAAATTYEIKAHCGDDVAQAASCQRIYDASAGARDGVRRGPRGVRGGLRARLHRFKRRLGGLVGSCTAEWRRQTALGDAPSSSRARPRSPGPARTGRCWRSPRRGGMTASGRPSSTPCASGCVRSRRRDARDDRRDAPGPHRGAPPGTHEMARRMPARSIPLPPRLRPRLRLHHGSQGMVDTGWVS